MNDSAARELKDPVERSLELLKDKVAEPLDTDAHRRPWVYIGLAALLSLLLGFLLGRKGRR